MVEKHFEQKRLIPVLNDYWVTYPALYLYFPKNSQKARRIRLLIDFLTERLATH